VTFVSYAQNFEDVLLFRALRGVTGGFYIDVGAAHPDTDSVTRAFYDRGWSGINIEPTADYALRLAAARPRDINLQMVLGERPGRTKLFVVDGTGLSTTVPAYLGQIRNAGMDVHAADVVVETLATICRNHAPSTIHFLKIDVEGDERAVLAGADLVSFRPWIVLVEATAPMSTVETHDEWEFMLLDADYRFVWFDGLNRFYVAAEMHDALKAAFRTPPNVFDDFLRAADSELVRRIHEAEGSASALRERLSPAEERVSHLNGLVVQLNARAVAAEKEADYEALAAVRARLRGDDLMRDVTQLRQSLRIEASRREAAEAAARGAESRAVGAELHAASQAQRAVYEAERSAIHEQRQREAVAAFEAMLTSTSWRITAPLRRLRSKRRVTGPAIAQAPAPPRLERHAESTALLATPKPPRANSRPFAVPYRQTVHQFHSGAANGDAITNSMLLTRERLRALGYRSDIFVTHRDPSLTQDLRLIEELPHHEHYVLIVRHSMGFDSFEEVASLPAPKVLLYHNITPPDLLQGEEFLQRYAAMGREQLKAWRPLVCTSLADSEFNAIELRALGFDPVQVCNTLLDIDGLLARAAAAPRRDHAEPFTILFVGRVVRSKSQAELIDVFAAFRSRYGKPCRLVLVGRQVGAEDVYVHTIETRLSAYRVGLDVLLKGGVSDDELHAWYARADVYLSLSSHEGFGVPLVEAMAHDVPVLARASGAVPYTLHGTGGLLADDTTDGVVARLLQLAEDGTERAGLIRRQRAALDRFRWLNNESVLLQAVSAAGAVPPTSPAAHDAMAAAMQVTVTGHVNGSYSLAAINRTLALTLEAARPGSVRLRPVEGEPTTSLAAVPEDEKPQIARLAARPDPVTGPHIVISQHYPVYVPVEPCDLPLAYFFWEESVVPLATIKGLNAHFKGVLAPSRFVAKTLIDSGLCIPVRMVGLTPRLEVFQDIAKRRRNAAGRPFTFLHISSGFPRKGVDVLLEAFQRAFRRHDPVRLLIKVFPNPLNEVSAQILRLREADPDTAEIMLLDRDIGEAELLDLYSHADAVVLPTRGEGFNLPAAEAMAAGLPVIVTGYSGHLDFCDKSVRLIDYRFAPSCSHLAVAGSLWVEPDVEDLALAMTGAVQDRPVIAAPPRLPDPRGFADAIISAAADLLLQPRLRRPLRLGWVSSWGVRCGIAEYSRHLIRAMLAQEDACEITVFRDTRLSAEVPEDIAIDVLPCWELGLLNGAGPLTRAITTCDPDVLVIQHQPGLITWPALTELLSSACLADRPVVLVLHTTRRILDIEMNERTALIDSFRTVARVVVHTIDDLNRLKALSLVDNVTMIPQGAPASDGDAARGAARMEEGPSVIGCYGFFFVEKGIRQLIEAIGRLRGRGNVLLRLVNADYGSPESKAEIARCRAAAEKAGVADQVEWHTEFLSDDQSLALLRGCDLIVLPYQVSKEGSSAALRMALSSGVPVAVTPLPLFSEAENAVYRLRGTEASDLAEGIDFLLDRPQTLESLRDDAGAWLAQRRWPLIAARFHGMVRGLYINTDCRGSGGSGGGKEEVAAVILEECDA
jgi:FkbM family methyltransferase